MSIDTLVSRTDFAGAFKAVKPHVLPKAEAGNMAAGFSPLRNVEIRFYEDHLTMTATNRHTLAESRVNYSGTSRIADTDVAPLSGTAVLVNVDDLAYAIKRASANSLLSVQLKDNTLVLDYTTAAPLDQESSFPTLSHIWPADDATVEVSSILLDPAYLAMFDSKNLARRKNDGYLRLTFRGQSKPVAVSYADHFRGLVVPVREAS